MSVPSDRLSRPTLTEEDRRGAPRVAALGANYLAQSFVRRSDDIRELRALTGSAALPIIAKIETPQGQSITSRPSPAAADGLMVARGDLGVNSLPREKVPVIQKELLAAADRREPVIVATQMLDSMIVDAADARGVERRRQRDLRRHRRGDALARRRAASTRSWQSRPQPGSRPSATDAAPHTSSAGRMPTAETDADALAYAAVALAGAEADVAAIACYTRSGRTARILSSLRPRVPILAFSPDPGRRRRARARARRACPSVRGRGRLPGSRFLSGHLEAEPGLPAGSAVVLVASTAAPGSGPNLLEVARVVRASS